MTSTPKTNKSLKAQKPYSTMLQRQENEQLIMELPLKKKKTMEVTNLKLSVFDSKGIKLSIPMPNIRSIAPLKKDKIRIQYQDFKDEGYGPVSDRRYIDYDLHKPKLSALQLCHQIKDAHEKINTWGKNDHGLLLMCPQEHVVMTYPNVKTNQGTGLLYITNVGMALEVQEGIVFDVPYEKMVLITDHKKDKIRVLWDETNTDKREKFDFTMPKKLDRNIATSLIKKEFAEYRKKSGWEFVQAEKKFGNLSYDEMYNLIRAKNPEFKWYIYWHVEHTYGFNFVQFAEQDGSIIRACKLLGIDLNLVKDISPEEMQQRKEAQEFSEYNDRILKEEKELYDEIVKMEKTCSNPDEIKKMLKNKDYQKLVKTYSDTTKQHPKVRNNGFYINSVRGQSLTASDKRVKIIYDEWCKTHPLENFTDEYKDEWIHYLLNKLNTPQGHEPECSSTLSYDHLNEELKDRDRNRSTLTNFAAPDGIPAEHIWNNCWYDERHKIYYVQDDNLSDYLTEKADSDPDHSQTMIGRRVWGFAEDQVEMFCGLPSVVVETEDQKSSCYLHRVSFERETGRELGEWVYRARNYILPIVREEDITEEMTDKSARMTYQTAEIQCCIKPSGGYEPCTPKMLKLYGQKYNFANDIPLNERVRRALFAVESCERFDVQAPMGYATAPHTTKKHVIDPGLFGVGGSVLGYEPWICSDVQEWMKKYDGKTPWGDGGEYGLTYNWDLMRANQRDYGSFCHFDPDKIVRQAQNEKDVIA